MKVPITHRCYIFTGFVLSGWLFFFPGWVKLPDEQIKKWEGFKISDKDLKRLYIGLEIKRRLKRWLMRLRG